MMLEILKELGLNEYESKAYSSLLQIKKSNASNLAKISKIPQSKIYSVLDSLINKGFVIYTLEGSKKSYMPAPLPKIKEVIRQKKEALEKTNDFITQQYQQKFFDFTNTAIVFKGISGFKNFLANIIVEKPSFVYILGPPKELTDIFEKYFEYWSKEIINNNIELKIIYEATNKKIAKKRKQKLNIETRITTKKHILSWLYITPEYVAFATLVPDITVFVIYSKEIQKNMLFQFNQAWEKSKPIK